MERDGIGRSKVRSLADSSLIITHQSSMCKDVRVCSKVDNASDFYSFFFLQNEKRSFLCFFSKNSRYNFEQTKTSSSSSFS